MYDSEYASTTQYPSRPLPSPPPEAALKSAKLAALHARLSLSKRIPIQTLARTLIDTSADKNPLFNNVSLAFLGKTLISYHLSEWLLCRFPRLPMSIFYAAMKSYAGFTSLGDVARGWGVEAAADPGEEVDPGLLQFAFDERNLANKGMGYIRPEAEKLEKWGWRRGLSSRVVMDDDFGELVSSGTAISGADETPSAQEAALAEEYSNNDDSSNELSANPEQRHRSAQVLTFRDPDMKTKLSDMAHATFVQAVIGAIYTHSGRESAKAFIKSHILSRHLDFESLFSFDMPTRELARLCAREEFEAPRARLLSETGRRSRTPVYVVGIYSGNDKLGEGAAASLDHARTKAAMNALKAWYLYSPGEDVRVPSDMAIKGAKAWEPVYIDIGEVV